jgi:hypothetical protein
MKPYTLSEGWRIGNDTDKSYTLEKLSIVQTGENAGQERWENDGYYTSLESLLKSYMNKKIRLSDKDLISAFRDVCREIKAMESEWHSLPRVNVTYGRPSDPVSQS